MPVPLCRPWPCGRAAWWCADGFVPDGGRIAGSWGTLLSQYWVALDSLACGHGALRAIVRLYGLLGSHQGSGMYLLEFVLRVSCTWLLCGSGTGRLRGVI